MNVATRTNGTRLGRGVSRSKAMAALRVRRGEPRARPKNEPYRLFFVGSQLGLGRGRLRLWLPKVFLGTAREGAGSVRLQAANGHFVRRHPPKSLKFPDATDKAHPPSTDDQLNFEGVADIFDASSRHVRRLVDADVLDGLGRRKRATGSAPCSVGWAPSPSPEAKAPRSRSLLGPKDVQTLHATAVF
jgi:hypothetical protein